jgi:hypothetical protein
MAGFGKNYEIGTGSANEVSMAPTGAKLPMWYRVLATVVGVLALISAAIVLADPLLAVWLLIFLLAMGLLFIGMDRLVIGISGQPLWWVVPVAPTSSSGTAPGPTSPPKS